MPSSDSTNDLKKALRQSKAMIPAHLVFLVFVAIVCVLLEAFDRPPRWLYVLLLGGGAFGLLFDVFNILHCERKIRALKDGP